MLNCRRYAIAITTAATMLVIGACSEQGERLNAPPQGDTDRPSPLQDNFTYMVDKGMLYDSSIADIHFEPHTAALSGLGIRRLTRMAELMESNGGTINYETFDKDADLTVRRLDTVRDFLASSGFDCDKIQVTTGLSQGRGMPAAKSVLGMQQAAATTAVPVDVTAPTAQPPAQ